MENQLVKISDLGIASALVSCDIRLHSTAHDWKNRVDFLFESSPRLERVIKAYQENTLQVRARSFFDNTKMLKNIIYSEKSNPAL
jgi:hypothetical protein